MKRGLWIWIVTSSGLGLTALGCTNNSGEALDTPRPTLIEVSPELFLRDVPCGTEPGTLQSYVATLFDMTAVGEGGASSDGPEYLELPSSRPVPCNRSVAFTQVVPGHAYAARIHGFLRSADELEQPEAGVPLVVVPGTQTVVSPDWTAECGAPPTVDEAPGAGGASRVVSQYQETRKVQPCDPLVRYAEETPTAVVVGLDASACEELGITSFTVRRDGAAIGSAGCGETIELSPPDVQAGQFVALELIAFGDDPDVPAFGASCTAKVLSGVRIAASCEELEENGGIRIDVADVLTSLGTSCADPVDVVLSIADSSVAPIRLNRESCRGIARFGELPPGTYSVRAESALLARSATCVATVEPGLSALAICTANP